MKNNTLEFYPFRIFSQNGKNYIFSGEMSGIFEIDKKTQAIIAQKGKPLSEAYDNVSQLMTESEFENLIEKMNNFRFIRTQETDETIHRLRSSTMQIGVNSLILFVIQGCNLRCSYCFATDGEYHDKGIMSLGTAKKAVTFLAKHSPSDTPSLSFFGGEPLLNFKLLKKLVPHIHKVEKKYNKQFSMGITTNGTLLDKEVKDFLIQNNIRCMISMDGNQQTQDANRRFANDSGSYDLVVEKTRDMRENNQLSCRATVTPISLDVSASFEHLTELNFTGVFFDAAKNVMSEKEYEEYGRQLVHLFEELKEMADAGEYELVKKSSNLMNFLRLIHRAGLRKSSCGAGQSVIAVDIHGDIYPCQRYVSEKDYCIGNVYTGWTNKDVRNNFLDAVNIENHTQCSNCWAKNLCMGDCAYENLMQTGSISQTSEAICKHKKEIFEAAIQLYLSLPEDFKESLN